MNETVEITLTQGKVALIDSDDYQLVSPYSWCAHLDSSKLNANTYYAMTTDYSNGKRTLLMHALITGYYRTDHVNGDGLDNRRSNLRESTHGQNNANRSMQINNTSGYKGVSWHRRANRYFAQIQTDKINYHLGYFDDPRDAAHAYDQAAIKYFGEYALTNEQMGLLDARET